MLCNYGCGKEAQYEMTNGRWCCSKHYSQCPTIREKNRIGTIKAHKDGRMRSDFGGKRHVFTEEDKTKSAEILKTHYDLVGRIGKKTIRLHYIAKVGNKCEKCGITEWYGKPLNLDLHHIDGDRQNNNDENLSLLCPNCHSQTPNYRGHGQSPKGVQTVTDQQIIDAVKETKNIRQALLKVGLVAKGANYARVTKILMQYNGGVVERNSLRT